MSLDQPSQKHDLTPTQLAQLQRLAIGSDQIQDNQVFLSASQHHYLSRVLRLAVGDRFIAMDGQGNWWLAELIIPAGSADGIAQLLDQIPIHNELPVTLRLVAALPKGNGFDEVVRQTTELGVGEIWPVISDRTLLRPSTQKWDRWRRIAQEAAEQAERQVVPLIHPLQSWTTFLQQVPKSTGSHSHSSYICVTRQSAPPLLKIIQQQVLNASGFSATSGSTIPQITLAIGPEGGWTEAEIQQAIAAGFQPVSLGKRVLRAVTAPIAALAILMATVE